MTRKSEGLIAHGTLTKFGAVYCHVEQELTRLSIHPVAHATLKWLRVGMRDDVSLTGRQMIESFPTRTARMGFQLTVAVEVLLEVAHHGKRFAAQITGVRFW